MATVTVQIGDITIAEDSTGAPWRLERGGVEGWFDGTGVDVDDVQRLTEHGSFAVPARRTGRLVTVRAAALCESDADAGHARRVAAGLLGDGGFGTLTVTEPDGHESSAQVRLAGQPLIDWMPDRKTVRCMWQFFAPDPRRYGVPQSLSTGMPVDLGGLQYPLYTDGQGADVGFLDYGEFGSEGRLTVANGGTTDTWPRFTVTGPAPQGFSLTEATTGRLLLFVGPIADGETLTLDAASGEVVLDDAVSRSSELIRREWTSVPAQGSLTFLFNAPAGDPTVTVEWTEAWW